MTFKDSSCTLYSKILKWDVDTVAFVGIECPLTIMSLTTTYTASPYTVDNSC